MARRVEAPQENVQIEITYLQPELFNVEFMAKKLVELGASRTAVQNFDRAKVMKLFYQHLTPKPQREYPDTRIGKLLKKLQLMSDRRIKTYQGRGKQTGQNEDWKKLIMETKSEAQKKLTFVSSANIDQNSSAESERLRPPVSCINTERKKIKLGGRSSSSLNSIVITSHSSKPKATAETPDKGAKSAVDGEKKGEKRSLTSGFQSTKVIRVGSVSENKAEKESGSGEKPKKIKLISWP